MLSQIITFMVKILLPLWLVIYYIDSWFLSNSWWVLHLLMTFITFMVSITFTGDTLVHERLSLAERDAGIKGNSVFLYIIIFAIYCF